MRISDWSSDVCSSDLLLPDEAPDGRPRLAGKDKGLPAGVGMLGLGPEYLYLITVLDLRPERHDAPVDLRPDRLVAKIGMHRIGEIHRRRTARKLDQLPLRGEGEHLSLEHGEPGVLQQFLRTCRMSEDFQQV